MTQVLLNLYMEVLTRPRPHLRYLLNQKIDLRKPRLVFNFVIRDSNMGNFMPLQDYGVVACPKKIAKELHGAVNYKLVMVLIMMFSYPSPTPSDLKSHPFGQTFHFFHLEFLTGPCQEGISFSTRG